MPLGAYSQGFQVNLYGQRQTAMGITGTGLVQDGASVLFNPGAVAMLKENQVQGGMSPLFFKSAFVSSGSDRQYNVKNKLATPFAAYGVWGPKNGRWKAGLGIYTPFGGLVDWGNDWEGKYVLEKLDLKAIYFQPTFSIRLTNQLSIGAGLVYNHGIVNLTRALPVSDANGNDAQAQLKGTGHGWGYNAGIYYQPVKQFSVGLSYRSKVNTTIRNGDAIFTVPGSLRASFPEGNTFNSSLPLPAVASIGFGFYPTTRLTLAVDASYVHWSSYQSLDFDYAQNTTTLQDTHSPRNYRNAGAFRAGGEYKLTGQLALRAGGGYAITPVKDGYVTPEAPDANRYYLTAGIGYNINQHFNLDASFLYEHLGARTQTNIESKLSGTFKTQVYAPGISLTYHW